MENQNKKSIPVNESDIKHLNWLYERLNQTDSGQTDFMIRFRSIIDRLESNVKTVDQNDESFQFINEPVTSFDFVTQIVIDAMKSIDNKIKRDIESNIQRSNRDWVRLKKPQITDRDSWWCGVNATIPFTSFGDALEYWESHKLELSTTESSRKQPETSFMNALDAKLLANRTERMAIIRKIASWKFNSECGQTIEMIECQLNEIDELRQQFIQNSIRFGLLDKIKSFNVDQ